MLPSLVELHNDDDKRKRTAKDKFFTWNSLDVWRERVLHELTLEHSPVFDIVDRGALPVRSNRNGRWFGITGMSMLFKGQKTRPGEPFPMRWRWRLEDFLKSNEHMSGPWSSFGLLDNNSGNFQLKLSNDFVVDASQSIGVRASRCLQLTNLYPRNTNIEWLTGGDLLHACGIVFALLDVQTLIVCEGISVRSSVEKKRRESNPEYFYYGKYILGPPQHLVQADEPEWFEYPTTSLPDKESFYRIERSTPHWQFYERRVERPAETTMWCWMWTKEPRKDGAA